MRSLKCLILLNFAVLGACASVYFPKRDTKKEFSCDRYQSLVANFDTWQIWICENPSRQKVMAEVWDRSFLYSKEKQKRLSTEEAANWLNDPKFKLSSVQLTNAESIATLIGADRTNKCYDSFGRQKILVLTPGNQPRWREIEYATSHLENPEIVLAQIEVDPKAGQLIETSGSGDFKCWFEPPTD